MRHLLIGAVMSTAVLACGGAAPRSSGAAPGSADAPTPVDRGAAGSADAPPGAAGIDGAHVTAVRITHGLMTSVMDSPGGQRDKARVAVEGSALVSQLTGLGVTVTVAFDPAAGDDVVVTTPEGHELGRVPLGDLEDKGAGAAIVDAVQAHR